MKLDGQELPEAIVQAWLADIDRMPPGDVRLLAQQRPAVMRGFRPAALDLRIARDRLKADMRRAPELPADIRAMLRANGLASSLLVVLSEDALDRVAGPLAAFFGVSEMAAAVLLDDRRAVRDHAASLLAGRVEVRLAAVDREAAAARLLAAIGPFFGHMREILAAHDRARVAAVDCVDARPAAESQAAEPAPRPPRPRREAKLVAALRDKRKEALRLARENRRLETCLDQALADAAAAGDQLTEARDEIAALRLELEALNREFGARVESAVRARLDERLLPWLAPAEALQAATRALGLGNPGSDAQPRGAAEPGEAEPMRAARALLDRQAQVDRRYGLRSALRAERERCIALQGRLHEARVEAIRPLAELAAGIEALDAHLRRIDAALDHGAGRPQAESTPALERLAQALAVAESLDDVAGLRRGLIASEPLALLTEQELVQAYALLGQASSRLYARAGVALGWADSRASLNGLPLFAVQAALSQGRRCTLVVDGHNVLWKLPALFRPHFEQGLPGGRARRALEAALLVLAGQHPALSIRLWFDGSVMEDRALAPNLRTHYSGGTGANRADGQMLAYLAHLNASGSGEVRTVVTADRDVAVSAQSSGALAMTPLELAAWMA